VRILFVLSGNNREIGFVSGAAARDSAVSEPGPLPGAAVLPVKNPVHQAATLRKLGHDVDLYFIRGRGLAGYLSAVPGIRRKIMQGRYDIIHAHYSLTAFAVSLACTRKIIVSLTGSDLMGVTLMLPVTRFFSRFRWKKVIVKTPEMKTRLKCGDITVLPNGVDTEMFAPSDKSEARKRLGLRRDKIVLFVADPSRYEKNFPLAQEAVRRTGRDDTTLLPVFGVPHELMPDYYNAADVLLLTSLWEGSVNSVKEAMACNLPVVSTDVGDVRINTSGLDGYYVTGFDASAISTKVDEAIRKYKPVNARDRIFELKLDSASVAGRLIEIYNSVNS